ncbi:HLH54F [Frankliniella occidentalis]|nr:HLH54F [Frankliniella occidentalis]
MKYPSVPSGPALAGGGRGRRCETTLPWVPADTKLSKLDTLRLATSYIAHLRDVLLLPEGEAPASAHTHSPASNPLNLTWPFTFPQPGGPGVPLVGPEPWISRGAAAASSRCGQSSRGPTTPSGADKHPAARGDGSGGSSNASSSSSGADDDPGLRDDEEHEESEEQAQCRRGLSGGRLVDLQQLQQQLPQLPQLPQHCHSYQPQADYHPYLQRYVDSSMPL